MRIKKVKQKMIKYSQKEEMTNWLNLFENLRVRCPLFYLLFWHLFSLLLLLLLSLCKFQNFFTKKKKKKHEWINKFVVFYSFYGKNNEMLLLLKGGKTALVYFVDKFCDWFIIQLCMCVWAGDDITTTATTITKTIIAK